MRSHVLIAIPATLLISTVALFGSACSSSTDSPETGTQPTSPATTGDSSVTAPPSSSGNPGVADAGDAGTKIDSGSDAATETDAGPQAFTKMEVQELFDNECTSCHSGDNARQGMDLSGDFSAATVGVASRQLPTMKRIQAGDRTKSYLFHKVAGTHKTVGGTDEQMPRNSAALDGETIERLGKYIDQL